MEVLYFISGAVVFALGFYSGRKSFGGGGANEYEKLYAGKHGLYKPVKNNGEGR